ncbi:MAG: M50 family metallopeptidase [Gemmatimonadetes bacterium]|nr:M50 family metallopeptidase [Gemmatimonadota bacterium]
MAPNETENRPKTPVLIWICRVFSGPWFLWDSPLVYPLKTFVVLLHEISHGIAALATGGLNDRITLDAQQGGACYCAGGNPFMTLSAGYLGSLLWGGLMFSLARAKRMNTRWINSFIGMAVIVLSLLYIRSGFGLIFGILFGVSLLFVAQKTGPGVNRGALFTLGLTSTLYAILDIKSDVLDRPEAVSDARMLADLTGIPTPVWGIIWTSIAIIFSLWLLHRAYEEA